MKWIFTALAAILVASFLTSLDIGRNDFQAYWLGVQLFFSGKNPYDLQLHQQLAAGVAGVSSGALQLWNPPWIFLILSPIALWNFPTALFALQLTNVCLAAALGVLAARMFRERIKSSVVAALLAFSFPPIIINLYLGQLGILIAFGVLLGLWALQQRRDYLAGFAFLLALPKPHSWFLFIPLIGLFVFKQQRWQVLLAGVGGLLLLSGGCLIINPKIFSLWLSLDNDPLVWASSSGVTLARMFFSNGGMMSEWPLFALPFLSILVICGLFFKLQNRIEPEVAYVCVSVLCCLTTPFGWVFDQTLLVVSYILAVAYGFRFSAGRFVASRRSIAIAVLPTLSFPVFFRFDPVWYALFPLQIVLLWIYARFRYVRNRSSDDLELDIA